MYNVAKDLFKENPVLFIKESEKMHHGFQKILSSTTGSRLLIVRNVC